MRDDCPFCGITDREDEHVLFENDRVVAVLDANPHTPGHTLVVPRDHYDRIRDLPPRVASSLFETIRRLLPTVEGAVGAAASNVAFNDGDAAGRDVAHVHGHVIPRFEGDMDGDPLGASGALATVVAPPSGDRPDEVASRIRTRLDRSNTPSDE